MPLFLLVLAGLMRRWRSRRGSPEEHERQDAGDEVHTRLDVEQGQHPEAVAQGAGQRHPAELRQRGRGGVGSKDAAPIRVSHALLQEGRHPGDIAAPRQPGQSEEGGRNRQGIGRGNRRRVPDREVDEPEENGLQADEARDREPPADRPDKVDRVGDARDAVRHDGGLAGARRDDVRPVAPPRRGPPQAHVPRDRGQPGVSSRGLPQLVTLPPCLDEGVLREVLRRLRVAGQARAEANEARIVHRQGDIRVPPRISAIRYHDPSPFMPSRLVVRQALS